MIESPNTDVANSISIEVRSECETDDFSHSFKKQDTWKIVEKWRSKKLWLLLYALLSISDVFTDWWLIELWILDGHIWYPVISVTSILVSGLIAFMQSINVQSINVSQESSKRKYFITFPLYLVGLGSTITLWKTLRGNDSDRVDCVCWMEYVLANKLKTRIEVVPIMLVTGYTIFIGINEEVALFDVRMVTWVSYFLNVLSFCYSIMVIENFKTNHFKKISTAVDFFLECIGVVSEIHMRIFVPGFIILFLNTDFDLRFFVLFWLLTCVIHVRTNVKKVFAVGSNCYVFTLACLWCITMVSYLVSECGETSWRKGFMKYRGMLQNVICYSISVVSNNKQLFVYQQPSHLCLL